MKKVSFWCALASVLFTISCNNGKEQALQQQLDSVKAQYNQQLGDYEDLNGYLSIIASGLDSISLQESKLDRIMQPNNNPNESPALNRTQIKENLQALQETLHNQAQRIEDLEKKLANSEGTAAKLKGVVAALKEQLTYKDGLINMLREEISNQNVSIDELKSLTLSLRQKNTKQAQLIDEQEKLITSQDQVMNEGFVKMGTKSELKKLGLISGGGLKKKKVEYSNVEQDLFDRVDIRDLHKLDIPGKNPQILTPMPEESYKLEKNGENTVLRILAPDRFWSVSNFLIIQTD